jgi:hypothetical protein
VARDSVGQIMEYKSFSQFYPFYLSQHKNRMCRLLHYIGLWLVIINFTLFIITKRVYFIVACPIVGYGFAWIGHFAFEKNKPAAFDYFFYSLLGDWKMFYQITTFKIKVFKSK